MILSPLRSALYGGAAWLLLLIGWGLAFPNLGIMELLLLLAPLVVIPLGFALLTEFRSHPLFRAVIGVQPIAALLAAASYLLAPGVPAAALAVPWFALTTCVALSGAARLKQSWSEGFSSLLATAGLFFLPVGGFWMVVNRLGIPFLGFGEPIVLLTAVHFHFTGFAAPLLAALAGRTVPNGKSRALLYVAGPALVAGPPLLAAGFVVSPVLQVTAALSLVAGVWALAILQLALLPRLRRRTARDLMCLSSMAIAAGMALAGIYSLGEYLQTEWISIPTMAWSHGILNGFGFVGCGFAAWLVERGSECA